MSPKNFVTIARIASLAWWIYVVVILSLFFGGLLLNYIVNKINEARLENRFTSLRSKVSTNQSTQVQRPIEINNKSTIPPQGSIAENLNKGISLIFNKEDNLLEDKRRKDDHPRNSGNSDCVITIDSSENVESNSSNHSAKEEMNRSVFLGTIYKELYEKRAAIEKTKSLSNTDRDSILNEIVDKMVWKMNESKSTPSIKKLIDIQNENDLKEWALDLVRKKDEAPALASTTGCC